VQCPTCGSLAGRWRGRCGNCGERPTLRAFGRLAFAEDPTAPPELRGPRPTELATPRARIIAAAIDLGLAALALLWSGALGTDQAFAHPVSLAEDVVRVLAFLAVLVTPILMEAAGGQTCGKRLVGIKVVSRETGGPISLPAAVHRGGARALFWFVTYLALGDPLLQPLHDRSAGTVVINVEASGWVPPPDSVIRSH
jgi:uncharacterized RDD family membrane protein YckC